MSTAFKRLAQRLQCLLPLLPDHVDLGVVGNGLERDVGYALVHEPLPDVVVGGRVGGCPASDLGFFELSVAAVGEQVVGIARAHDAGAGERQSHAGSVNGDPAAAPLLGDVGSGAGAAGWVEDEVAGVGGHEDATLDDSSVVAFEQHKSFWPNPLSAGSVRPYHIVPDNRE